VLSNTVCFESVALAVCALSQYVEAHTCVLSQQDVAVCFESVAVAMCALSQQELLSSPQLLSTGHGCCRVCFESVLVPCEPRVSAAAVCFESVAVSVCFESGSVAFSRSCGRVGDEN
jgi:uncharacterized membrane protein